LGSKLAKIQSAANAWMMDGWKATVGQVCQRQGIIVGSSKAEEKLVKKRKVQSN
jgi:hypothetical protein